MSRVRWWRSDLRRVTEITLTGVFWLAWLYFIAPLLSVLLWLAGIQLFREQVLARGGYEQLLADMQDYGLVVLAMLLVVLIWVDWNLRRYGDHNQRTGQPPAVSAGELAGYTGLSVQEVEALQAARHMLVDFDEQDQPQVRRLDTG
jgi:poly-beta-1,6-N-acetyl-D-glucosamine biosynthesis protein PgaD